MGRGESKLKRRERYLRQKKKIEIEIETPEPEAMSAPTSVREIRTQAGEHIELEQDLIYGNPISALSGDDRRAIEEWEREAVNRPIEYATALDANGVSLGEYKGKAGHVIVPEDVHKKAAVLTHNHPRIAKRNEEYLMGGTLSFQDMFNFANGEQIKRATAAEGTYCIAKTKNFDKDGFLKYIRSTVLHREVEYGNAGDEIRKKMKKNGFASYDEYRKAQANAFNNMVINLHNDYIAGQEKYGYEYSLEARK